MTGCFISFIFGPTRVNYYSCKQCYKHFTRLYLQICKYWAILKLTSSHKYCQIRYADACFDFLIRSIYAVENEYFEFENTRGYKWY